MTSQVREERLVGFFCFPFWHTLGSFSYLVSFWLLGFCVVVLWWLKVCSFGRLQGGCGGWVLRKTIRLQPEGSPQLTILLRFLKRYFARDFHERKTKETQLRHPVRQFKGAAPHTTIIPLLFEVGREGSNMTSQVREEQLVGFFCFPFWHTLGSFSDLVSFLVVGFLCGSFVVV